jgi:UDPglucose--hexose-1-phosphate uridylyltransferase
MQTKTGPVTSRSVKQGFMRAAFPQLRKDPIIDRWVLIAPERAARPTELEESGHLAHHASCPFCEGHETETPPEVLAQRQIGSTPNGPGWRVRVVPNLFPAVKKVSGTFCAAEKVPDTFLTAHGVHEVVVECPHHETSLATFSSEQVRDVFAAYRDRLAALRSDPQLAYVQIFKNHGAAAGASVEHAHAQILGTGFVPSEIQAEVDGAAAYHSKNGRCVFCDLVERELAAGERVVLAGEHIVAVTAWAGRFPYETWLLPRRHSAHYDRLTDAELGELADEMRTILQRLGNAASDAAYNFILHTAPMAADESFHWHWEILPRMTGIAGYELATGCYLNPLPPEEAARRLKSTED